MYDVGGESPQAAPKVEAPEPTKLEKREAARTAGREKAAALKAEYEKVKGTPAFLDLMAKVRGMSELHARVARDGVGAKDVPVTAANPSGTEVVQLTGEQRLRELDRAAGIDEILSMLERQIS